MAANYCRVIKQQVEELKHVTVFITELTFDQNAEVSQAHYTVTREKSGLTAKCSSVTHMW
jgi:hypothetical protein